MGTIRAGAFSAIGDRICVRFHARTIRGAGAGQNSIGLTPDGVPRPDCSEAGSVWRRHSFITFWRS